MSNASWNCLEREGGSDQTDMRTTYFLTHPIQYQTPLLQALSAARWDIEVVYASTETTWDGENGSEHTPLVWDIPLLEGYSYQCLQAPAKPAGFWEQLLHYRSAIRTWLSSHPTDMIWVHGWGNPYSLAALLESRRLGIPTVVRGESHLDCLKGPQWRRLLHRVALGWLFTKIERFLAIGTANRNFYLAYGVPAEKITLMPYVVDNEFFRQESALTARPPWHLHKDHQPVVMYAGKLASHKSVDLLIEALHQADRILPSHIQPRLLIVGEGEMRQKLQALAEKRLPGRAWFAGFRNQTEMPALYSLADIFVLPSQFEPWGLVVNEAMNAAKPVVVSDRVGARIDLVQPGVNGEVFTSGSSASLAQALLPLLSEPGRRSAYGRKSLERITSWGIPEAVAGWQECLTRHNTQSTSTPSHQIVRRSRFSANSSATTVSISYAYVHNAYQQAQAAAEIGRLEQFYCSCVDAKGNWGRWIGRLAGRETMASRGGSGIPQQSLVENPWPLLRGRLVERLSKAKHHDWFAVSAEFDRWAAPQIANDASQLVVAYETCSRDTFLMARKAGKRCLLDCPQFHPVFLWNLLAEAAERCSLPPPPPIDSPSTAARKQEEFNLADYLLVYSPLHAASFESAGFSSERILTAPLWIDPALWYAEDRIEKSHGQPLRLLFVGGASLRKGIPFLLKAIKACRFPVELTLAGDIDDAMAPLISTHSSFCRFIGPQTKPALRRIYASHDLLVLPSVADAFGFVALEAMACGLPVVVSDKCGVPVPDENWRVPAMNIDALHARFDHCYHHPELLKLDGLAGIQFSKSLTAAVFRERMQICYNTVLGTHAA